MYKIIKEIGKVFLLTVAVWLVVIVWFVSLWSGPEYDNSPMPKDEVLIDLFVTNRDDFEEIKHLSLELKLDGIYNVGTGPSSSGRYGDFYDFEVPKNLDALLLKHDVVWMILWSNCLEIAFYDKIDLTIHDMKSLYYCSVLKGNAQVVDTTDIAVMDDDEVVMYQHIEGNWYVSRFVWPTD